MATRRRRSAPGDRLGSGAYSSPACLLHEFEPHPPAVNSRGFEIKRIYAPPEPADGFRVLVDRLWPRGISRQRAALDDWLSELAPSTALRKWFHGDRARWSEFTTRYRAELRAQAAQLQVLRQRAAAQRVTLLYAARDACVNHAVVLRAVLRKSPRARRTVPRP